MAKQTSRLIGSDRQPNPRPDSNHCTVTRERAGHGAPDLKRRTGPRANRFQWINRLGEFLLPPHLFKVISSANEIKLSAFRVSVVFES